MKRTVCVWRVSLLACCFLAAAGCLAASQTWINLNPPGPYPEAPRVSWHIGSVRFRNKPAGCVCGPSKHL